MTIAALSRVSRRQSLAGLALLGVAQARPVNATAAGTVRLAVGDWPPYFAEHRRHFGAYARIVSLAFEHEGLGVEYTFVPWKRALVMMDNGAVHGSPGWLWTEDRARSYLYSDPVLTSRGAVFWLARSPFRLNSLADLAGRTLGGGIGYDYGVPIAEAERAGRLTLERIGSDEANLRKLLGGRLDGVLINREVGLDLLQTRFERAEAAEVLVSDWAPYEQASHLLMSRAIPEVPGLLLAFNRGLARVQRDGLPTG